MKLTIKKLAFSYFLIGLFLLLFFITVPVGNSERSNPVVYLTFFINGVLWTALLIKSLVRHPFSFEIIHWFFFLFFFFFAALVQYANNRFPWVGGGISDSTALMANVMLLTWTFFFIFGNLFRVRSRHHIIEGYLQKDIDKPSKSFLLLLVVLCVAIAASDIALTGFTNLLARATAGRGFSDNQSISLLLGHTRRAIVVMSGIYVASVWTCTRKHFLAGMVIALCLLVNSFPTALARYAMASIYGALLITLFPKLKRNRLFVVLFIIGFIVGLPFLNEFRNNAFEDVNIFKGLWKAAVGIPNTWLAGDYDAFTTLCMTIDYVTRNGITLGRQLMGVMFFFVPRQFWATKPIGSGAAIAGVSGMSFTNISCPLPGEAYINFGILGIVLFAFLFGWLTRKLDVVFWERGAEAVTRRIDLIYPLLVLMFFFMCRGDLLSSWAYAFANVVIWVLICFLYDVLKHVKICEREVK